MHVWEVLGSAVEVSVIDTLDWPTHVDRCVNADALYSRSSLRADGQVEAEKALPATPAGELEMIVAPKEGGSFLVDLTACTQ